MMKALVIGAAGQLGAATVERLETHGREPREPREPRQPNELRQPNEPHETRERVEVIALTRREVDLADGRALREAVLGAKPDVILNCAAYNDVDGAEGDPKAALDVNAFAPRVLAEAAEAIGATFVHYSTDFVFDGTATRPYTETDPARPQSVYASSKLLGEWFAAQAPRHYVLRVESLFGGTYVRGSIDKIISTIIAGEDTRVFVDRVVTPSYVQDVITATLGLIGGAPRSGSAPRSGGVPYGLYHCVNSGETTWFDLAREIARLLDRTPSLVPVKVADVKLRAKRPQYCALSNRKLAEAGIVMPAWQDALRRYLEVVQARAAARTT